MPTINIDKTIKAWLNLNDTLFVPHTDAEYQKLIVLLDDLIDEVGEDESHPLASLMEVIGLLIENYESNNIPELE